MAKKQSYDFMFNYEGAEGVVQGLVIEGVFISDLAGEVELRQNKKILTIGLLIL